MAKSGTSRRNVSNASLSDPTIGTKTKRRPGKAAAAWPNALRRRVSKAGRSASGSFQKWKFTATYGPVGSSPNPYGNDLGFTIGSYGKGYGKGQVWGYYADPENKTGLVLTHGTPATMPMYNAAMEVMRKAVEIAKEVWA